MFGKNTVLLDVSHGRVYERKSPNRHPPSLLCSDTPWLESLRTMHSASQRTWIVLKFSLALTSIPLYSMENDASYGGQPLPHCHNTEDKNIEDINLGKWHHLMDVVYTIP